MTTEDVPPGRPEQTAHDPGEPQDEVDVAGHPLLAPLRDDERSVLLAAVRTDRVAAGSRLIAAGDAPGPLLLVLRGTASIERDGVPLARVGAGSWIGELALLEDRPARSNVVAVDEMVLGVVAADDARRVLAIDGVALQLDGLARRRRAAVRAAEVGPVTVAVDGGPVAVRPVLTSDWAALADGDGRVSPRSLEMRFFTQPALTERTFRRLTDVDLRSAFAWAVLVDGLLVGVGRYALQAEDRGTAEVALLVADDHQRRGIGAVLVDAVSVAAAAHGAHDLLAIARAENLAVQRLLGRYGAVFDLGVDAPVVEARWPVATAVAAITDTARGAALARVAATVLAPVLTD